MKKVVEEKGKIVFNEKEYKIGDYIGNEHEGGIFIIESIVRNFVDETDKKEIFNGYEVGQELNPEFECSKIYVGSSFSKLKKPKFCIINSSSVISAEVILNERLETLEEQKYNVEEILELIK